jgi:uncharacterized membrane protein
MTARRNELALLALGVLPIIIGLCCYARMPESMASHWNSDGVVDGTMSRFWGVFLIPAIIVVLTALFYAIPKIDPLKENIKSFIAYYYGLVYVIVLFLTGIYVITLMWNLGKHVDFQVVMPIGLGALIFFIGSILTKMRRNWFVGIRTPWTLSSDSVWEKTHKLGAWLFRISGVLVLFGALFPDYLLGFILIPVLGTALYLVLYSYLEFKKEQAAR